MTSEILSWSQILVSLFYPVLFTDFSFGDLIYTLLTHRPPSTPLDCELICRFYRSSPRTV